MTTPEAARKDLARLLGPTWRQPRPAPRIVRHQIEDTADFVREDLVLDLGAEEPVTAILTRPHAARGRSGAVLYCHAHGGRYETGAIELIEGRPALQKPAYAAPLARLGLAALSLDMPCFGTRRAESEGARSKRLAWSGGTLFGAMLADLAGGLDYLAARPDIDAARIGAFGLSMGATHAFWLAALDDRIAAVAQLCVLADIGELIRIGAHDMHGHYMTVPGLLPAFSAGRIAGMLVPRPQYVGLGAEDALTPPEALSQAVLELEAAYAASPGKLMLRIEQNSAHAETPRHRAEVLAFLKAHLDKAN